MATCFNRLLTLCQSTALVVNAKAETLSTVLARVEMVLVAVMATPLTCTEKIPCKV
jgi:hypothetical protein